MQAPYFPARAAEFPNDNPNLHAGARWVCPSTLGRARAFVSARNLPAPALSAPLHPAPAASDAAAAAVGEWLLGDGRGPLELDLSRLVLPHRVENVPPPPAFVFRPFTPSPRLPASPPATEPLRPLRCWAIDECEAGRRVERRSGVDVAPCLRIEPSPALVAPNTPEPVSRRRRRVPVHGGPRSVALPSLMDLNRAISELEAAFAERPLSGDSFSARPALHAALPLAEAAGGAL